MKLTLNKPDVFGAFASGLCVVHCLATPFIFIAQTCSASGCNNSPFWWQCLDAVFITVAFVAVYFSAKNSAKQLLKILLWLSWVVLSVLTLNSHFGMLPNYSLLNNSVALLLTGLHIYNLNYCQCTDVACCNTKN